MVPIIAYPGAKLHISVPFDIPSCRRYYSSMVRAVKIVILLVWLVMTGMLIHRSYLRPAPVIALDAAMQEGVRPGDEWFGIFQQGRKIGYAHTSIAAEGDAYRLSEDSEMDILAMGRVQSPVRGDRAPAKANILWGGLLSRPFYSLAGNCLMIPSANPSAITII